MKNLIKVISIALVISGLTSFPSYANGEATYAVVDSSGLVTNVIVCQESVCGSSGSWAGTMPSDTPWAGQKLVLQVPANEITGKNQGGIFTSLDLATPKQLVTYDSNTKLFSTGSADGPAPVMRTEVVDSVTLSAIINSNTVTFGPDNFINGKMEFTPVVNTETEANISATKVNGNSRIVEDLSFSTPQTVEQIRASLTEELVMLRTYLNNLIVLLKGWVKN